jgi:S-adenosylmethionine hydrolase
MSIVTLTSDFGTVDGYVGEMKGEILSRCPEATLIDVTHEIAPRDIEGGSWTLERIWGRCPEGTIHLGVVDPGVGGSRRPVAVHAAGRWFIGPDNGLLSGVLAGSGASDARLLDPERFAPGVHSATFHGRDIFAPAAAWLASGRPEMGLGPEIEVAGLTRVERSEAHRVGGAIRGRVAHIDRFGNLVTDIPGSWLAPTALIEVGGEVVSGMTSTYADVEPGELVAVVGSAGTLEIAVRDGDAASRLGVPRGGEVSVRTERD